MPKKSKKEEKMTLEKRFPEFAKLSEEFKSSIEAVIWELEEQIDKLEDLQNKQDEVEQLREEMNL